MGQWLTPDDSGGAILCRRFAFRAELAEYITGVLQDLTQAGKWEQFGDLTPSEMSELATAALNSWCDSEDICMVGQLWTGITESVPDGVLLFDGTQYARVDYPELYAVIDPAFIDDGDYFTLPNAMGRALVIAGEGEGLDDHPIGERFGEPTVALEENEMPSHTHQYDKTVIAASTVLGVLEGLQLGAYEATWASFTGNGDAHNNVPPSFAVKVGVWSR